MRFVKIISVLVLAVLLIGLFKQSSSKFKKAKTTVSISKDLKEGDVFFQYNNSPTCNAIKIATKSKFSHCGILLLQNKEWYIFEAIGPVKYTPLNDWIQQGDDNYYEQLRCTKEIDLQKLKTYANVLNGKPYDSYYLWENEKIYCSELVWKLYNYAGIELCKTKKLKDYTLQDKLVQQQLEIRFGKDIPYEEEIVSPQDIYESKILEKLGHDAHNEAQ